MHFGGFRALGFLWGMFMFSRQELIHFKLTSDEIRKVETGTLGILGRYTNV